MRKVFLICLKETFFVIKLKYVEVGKGEMYYKSEINNIN